MSTVTVENGAFRPPGATNEPVLSYAPGSSERQTLERELDRMSGETLEMPLVIGGREVRTGRTDEVRMPHAHRRILGNAHLAAEEEVATAIAAAQAAWPEWSRRSAAERAAIFLKAADLLSRSWRATLNAATMLGQSKTVREAEIDSAAELIDFYRFYPFMLD